jgi:hypothetical protein
LINQYGKQVNIKNKIFKEKEKVINIYSEACNDFTKIYKNQMFITNEYNNIITPPKINWNLPNGNKSKDNYIFGFTIGFLLWSGVIIEDNNYLAYI